MPDDAALAAPHTVLRGAHAEILVRTVQLFHSGIEDDKIVDQFEEARFGTELNQCPVKQVLNGALFLPCKVIFLLRLNGTVAQPLGVIARHHPLHRGEEGLDEFFLLIIEVLANALGHRDRGAFQLQHAERNPVHIQHHIRTLGVGIGIGGQHRDFLSDGEVVLLRVLPVDQPNGLGILPDASLHLYAIAQQFIDSLVAVVQLLARVTRRLVEDV